MDNNNSAEIVDPMKTPVRSNVHRPLFKHNSPVIVETNGDRKNDEDDKKEECEDDDVELCGSQGRKRKKRKASSTPQKTRNTKKVKDKSANSTPKKNGVSNRKIENASPPTIPNLRLEAKLTAEENSRMFAGKQVHPFFSSWKVERKSQEVTEDESNQSTLQKETRSTTLGPIHIFERTKSGLESLDWGNWIFCERTLGEVGTLGEEGMISSAFGGLFESQCLNEIPGVSSVQNKLGPYQYVIQLDDSPPSSPTTSTVLFSTPLECEMNNVLSGSGDVGCLRKSDDEPQIGILQERMVPTCVGCGNEPENSLWTVKYQPDKATKVCGNSESVKFMSEWLHLWHGKDVQAIKDFTSSDKCSIEDGDYICCKRDADSDYVNEGTSLKNILLVTGPVGSGKSAAVYACAKEQGFRVFECNASETRNGALVKLKLGEVLESHCLPRSHENPGDSQSKLILKSQSQRNGKTVQERGIEIIELTSDDENSDGATTISGEYFFKDSQAAYYRGALKPLILFEDVDIIFSEDRGFINSVIQIAATAKGPVILTTNSKDPVLPKNLDRLEVHFTIPSQKDLLGYLNKIGAAEEVNIQPHLMEQLIECCEGDIRKSIMHLQFWHQGRGSTKDKKAQVEWDSLIFDLEVGHRLLPKIIPWAFPSQLSEFVDKKISKSLFTMEQNPTFMDVVKEGLDNEEMQNGWEMHDTEIEFKKEATLNGCIDTCNEFGDVISSDCDFSNPVDTPVARKKCRRKLAMVMSSDSEDELVNNVVPPATDENIRLDSHSPNSQNCTYPLSDKQLCSEVENISCKFFETDHDMKFNVMHKSVDMSYVPESSFVPETKIDDGTEFKTLEASVNNEFEQNLSVNINGNPDNSILRLHKSSDLLGNALNVVAKSSNVEVLDNSRIERINICTKGYQEMDKYRRMDFIMSSNPIEEHKYGIATNSMQESWKVLHDSRTDLKQYETSKEKMVSRVLKLALGMTNVISEADLLLSRCQIPDHLKLARGTSEESEVFSKSDEQFQMTFTFAENGFFFYAKDIPATNLDISCERRINLTEEMLEMLASSANIMTCGKLIERDQRVLMSSAMNPPENEMLLKSRLKFDAFDTIKSIVPSRSLLTLKGIAHHEYLSSLGCISRSEALRISGCGQKTRKRRGRVSRHYLSSLMSPDDISLMGQYDLGRTCLSNQEETNSKIEENNGRN